MLKENGISKYLNNTEDPKLYEQHVTTEELTSTHMGTSTPSDNETLEKIKETIKKELVKYGYVFGELNYKLAKVLYEQTKDLTFTNTHRIYAFVSDFLGISIQTIKNLVHIYKKLEKFNLWHNQTGLFKLRLFQLTHYIMRKTSEPDIVLSKAYYEIMNDTKLRIWFENSSYKEIIQWFKMRFETYLKVFKPKVTVNAICDICHSELKIEDFNKTWSYLPICFNCYDLLKEENKEKIHMLKNAIAKRLENSEIESLRSEVDSLKSELVKTIDTLDKIKLAKSRKYKKLRDNINNYSTIL